MVKADYLNFADELQAFSTILIRRSAASQDQTELMSVVDVAVPTFPISFNT